MEGKVNIADLTKENSNCIGFVLASLFSSAIDMSELNQWAVSTIERLSVEQIPDYVYDLVGYDSSPAGIYKMIGFYPVWKRSKEADAALYGIAIQRGKNIFDIPVTEEYALSCLQKKIGVKEIFNNVFPFIAI